MARATLILSAKSRWVATSLFVIPKQGEGGRAEAWKERQIGSYIERTDKGAGIVRLRALLNPISGGKGTRLD